MDDKLKLAYFSVLKVLGDTCQYNKGNKTFQSTNHINYKLNNKISKYMINKGIDELLIRGMIEKSSGINYLPKDFETPTFKPGKNKRQDAVRYISLTEKGWNKFYEINRKLTNL